MAISLRALRGEKVEAPAQPRNKPRKVDVEVSETEVDGDYGYCQGVEVTCGRCSHTVSVCGTSERSIKRGCMMLKEECPEGESNFYAHQEQQDCYVYRDDED